MVADAEQLYIVSKNNGEELVTSINNLETMKNKGNLQNWFNLTKNGNLIALSPFSGTYAFYNQSGDFLSPIEDWEEVEHLMEQCPQIYFEKGIYLKPEKIHTPEWKFISKKIIEETFPEKWELSSNGGDYYFKTTEWLFYNNHENIFATVLTESTSADFTYTSTGVFTENVKWHDCELSDGGMFCFTEQANHNEQVKSSIELLPNYVPLTWQELFRWDKKKFIQAKIKLGISNKSFYSKKRGWMSREEMEKRQRERKRERR